MNWRKDDYSELRAKAQAATPGPWEKLGREARMDFWISSYHPDLGSKPVALIPPLCEAFTANAEYIAAASPDVVLALLDEVERLDQQWQDIADKASRIIARLEAEVGRSRAALEEAKVLLLKPSFICGRCPQIGRIVEAALNSSTEVTP